MKTYQLLSAMSSTVLFSLVVFAVLQYFQLPMGNFVDWLVALGTFLWLMLIVTVPWNIHFEASAVLQEARQAQRKGIQFDSEQLPYVKKLYFWGLIVAIFLHIFSAALLYYLAYAQVSVVGYYGAGLAILLTFLRPAVRLYEYISERLASIRHDVNYPHNDVLELKATLQTWQAEVEKILQLLDEEKEDSWRTQQNIQMQKHKAELQHLQQQIALGQQENQREHEKIMKETRQAVAQLTEDGKFIDNLVEIIRFIKRV